MHRLCIADNSKPLVTVKGFADYTDVNAEDLVPWTPLKAGEDTAAVANQVVC